MKIAVPTLDGIRISPHFGRSTAFLVFDTEAGVIRSRETRPNLHGHQVHAGAGHDHGHGHHDHAGFVALLRDCAVVLSGGMGAGALNALQGAGLTVRLLRPPMGAEEAVERFLAGRLPEPGAAVCRGHAHP